MPEIVYMVAEEHFTGNLSALSQAAHVWVWLTEHNTSLYRAACASDRRDYAPHYGLSGYLVKGDALESLYYYLGTVDEHHDDPPWEELRIIGLQASQLDPVRVHRELDVGEISIRDEDGEVVIRRAS